MPTIPTRTIFSPPTRVIPRQADTATVTVTQTVLPTSGATPATSGTQLNGGAIAGIVIGSIVGLLLILWLVWSCTNFGAPPSYGSNDRHWYTAGRSGSDLESTYSRSPHRHRHHRRHHHHGNHHHHHPRVVREVSERQTVRPTIVVADGRSVSPRRPASAHYHHSRGRSLNTRD